MCVGRVYYGRSRLLCRLGDESFGGVFSGFFGCILHCFFGFFSLFLGSGFLGGSFLGSRIGRVFSSVFGRFRYFFSSFGGFLFGVVCCFLGLFTGLARVSNNFTLNGLAGIYVEVIRGTPLLVQIFIAYFFFGTVFDLNRNVAGIGALALFAGAYVAEIVRAGIQAIPKGQMEAARSLGMSLPYAMIEIILPQAFKKILPPLSGTFISLIKDSSLVSVIAITDLTKSGREIITSTFATFEIWLVVAAMYLIVTSVLSQFVFHMERRLAVSD